MIKTKIDDVITLVKRMARNIQTRTRFRENQVDMGINRHLLSISSASSTSYHIRKLRKKEGVIFDSCNFISQSHMLQKWQFIKKDTNVSLKWKNINILSSYDLMIPEPKTYFVNYRSTLCKRSWSWTSWIKKMIRSSKTWFRYNKTRMRGKKTQNRQLPNC